MRVDDFNYHLPEDRIALRPAHPRDSARLLYVNGSALADKSVRDLPSLLRPGDVLVVNDTRVIPAELAGERMRGEARSKIRATLLKRLDATRWAAFARPAKRIRAGDRVMFGEGNACQAAHLAGTVESRDEAEIVIAFDLAGPDLDVAIAQAGAMPLPHYIGAKRGADTRDLGDYQTIYARRAGAVAAPTAGLHFTPDLMAALAARGVTVEHVTLHVGAGTFLPVKTDDTADHRMHAEWCEVSAPTADALNAARARGGRIVAVGTTALRTLESATGEDGIIHPFSGDTRLFILPGYRFRAVDVLMSNFHLPRSTLLMLVSAFAGTDAIRAAYAHAIDAGYRFYSYGDATLLERAP